MNIYTIIKINPIIVFITVADTILIPREPLSISAESTDASYINVNVSRETSVLGMDLEVRIEYRIKSLETEDQWELQIFNYVGRESIWEIFVVNQDMLRK